ncbi:ABC transporter ATP-binding protein [Candidatus Berkelbacteria bacterium]|nr:ABC transporter ATP-binding protein [Candidatus Berkelbacteria bacterium]
MLRAYLSLLRLIWSVNPWWIGTRCVLTITSQLIPIVQLVIAQRLVDILVPGASGTPIDTDRAITYAAVEGGLFLVNILIGRIDFFLSNQFGEALEYASVRRMLTKAASLDVATFDQPVFRNMLSLIQRDIYWRPRQVYNDTFTAIAGITTLIAATSLFLQLPIWVIGLLVLGSLPTFWLQAEYGRANDELSVRFGEEHRFGHYFLTALTERYDAKDIRLYELGETFVKRHGQIWTWWLDELWQLSRKYLTLESLSLFLAGLIRLGIMLWLVLTTAQGQLTIGQFTLFGGLIGQFAAGFQSLIGTLAALITHQPFVRRFSEFLETKPVIESPTGGRTLSAKEPLTVEFDHVWFRYSPDAAWSLRDVSFVIDPGERVAFVGENGAGKTTLIKLLTRFYDPTKGRILLNGHDLTQYTLASLRRAIGVIFQDFAKFEVTAEENIGFGRIAAAKDRTGIYDAAKQSGADTVIAELPKQYETLLATGFAGGTELSGGQWQKIALGRSFFRNARLLILDEPTAALDAEAEEHFYKQFLKLRKSATAILISHRFSTVRMADTIYVLDHGQVVESGDHKTLMKANGRYAKLYALQAARYR